MSKLSIIESYFLSEARWKKEGVTLEDDYGKIAALAGEGHHYLSFTAIPKLGINPQSKYKTPLGIYTYAMADEWFWRAWNEHQFPFVADQPFVQVMRARSESGLVVIERGGALSKGKSLIQRAVSKYEKMIDTDDAHRYASKDVEQYDRPWINSVKGDAALFRWYWSFTRYLAIGDKGGSNRLAWISLWGKIMMNDGVMIIEDRGTGTIHQNEPHQAVVLSMAAVDHVLQAQNPLNDAKVKAPVRGVKREGRNYNKFKSEIAVHLEAFRRGASVIDQMGVGERQIDSMLTEAYRTAKLTPAGLKKAFYKDDVSGFVPSGVFEFEREAMGSLADGLELGGDLAKTWLLGEGAIGTEKRLSLIFSPKVIVGYDTFEFRYSDIFKRGAPIPPDVNSYFSVEVGKLRFNSSKIHVGNIYGIGLTSNVSKLSLVNCEISITKEDLMELGDFDAAEVKGAISNPKILEAVMKVILAGQFVRAARPDGPASGLNLSLVNCKFEVV